MGSVKPQAGKYRSCENLRPYDGITAKDLAKNPEFIKSCESKNVKPSPRQARDYRRKLGHWDKSSLSPITNISNAIV